MLPSAAFPLKEFGRFIKKNKADFSNLPHDSFKPWPSSALCSARVRACCQPLCTRATLPKQISTFWASLSLQHVPCPRDRRKANNCYTAKSPQVCERSEWLSQSVHSVSEISWLQARTVNQSDCSPSSPLHEHSSRSKAPPCPGKHW